MATDGVFDNTFDEEIVDIIRSTFTNKKVTDPEVVAANMIG